MDNHYRGAVVIMDFFQERIVENVQTKVPHRLDMELKMGLKGLRILLLMVNLLRWNQRRSFWKNRYVNPFGTIL